MSTAPLHGRKIAQAAGILCRDEQFRLYLDRRKRYKFDLTPEQLPDGTHNIDDARDWICQACGIGSRAELDHNPAAAHTFAGIRTRFQRWQKNRMH